jgi:hypothetical protein
MLTSADIEMSDPLIGTIDPFCPACRSRRPQKNVARALTDR